MRRIASRVLLVALAVLVVVAAVQLADGQGGATIWMKDIDADHLQHDRFELDQPVRLAVSASGSFEETRDVLAATAWITDPDGVVVWRLDGPRPERGTLLSVADTLELPAGLYDAYFASYGTGAPEPAAADGLLGRFRQSLSAGGAWRGDAGRWRLRVEPATNQDREHVRRVNDADDRAADGALWTSGRVRNDRRVEELLRVDTPTRVTLRAVLEATPDATLDSAMVVRLDAPAGETVWSFGYEGSEPAGGVDRNRRVDASLDLVPGLYRVIVQASPRHGANGWALNPPDAPWMWGLTLTGSDPADGVAVLAPSDKLSLPVIASFACAGEDVSLSERFALTVPTPALVVSAGEIISETVYDWGHLDRVAPDGATERLWELRRDGSVPAGGDDKNRMALGMLTLDPGDYQLTYVTDGSHHCGSFNSSEPDDPTFWGITVYALDGGFDPASVRRTAAAPEPTAMPADDATPLATIDEVESDVEEARGFRVATDGTVLVRASGLWDGDRQVAYGWIEDEDGTVVWTMRGDERAGLERVAHYVRLDAGTYTLRYRTRTLDALDGEIALLGIRVATATPPDAAPDSNEDDGSHTIEIDFDDDGVRINGESIRELTE